MENKGPQVFQLASLARIDQGTSVMYFNPMYISKITVSKSADFEMDPEKKKDIDPNRVVLWVYTAGDKDVAMMFECESEAVGLKTLGFILPSNLVRP